MNDRTYRWLLITLAVVGLTTDLVTKYRVFRWLYNDGQVVESHSGSYDVVPKWFMFTAQFDPSTPTSDCVLQTWSAPVMPRVNHGALFGLGGEHKGLANNIFALVSMGAALTILVWGMQRKTAREKWLMVALGLILGGTLGNLFDRIVFNGVRDFMFFYRIDWPVFNFADCCLVVGAGLLLMQAMFVPPMPEDKVAVEAPESPKV